MMKPLLESVVTRYVCLGKAISDQIVPIFNKMDTGKTGLIVSGVNSWKISGEGVRDSLEQAGVELNSFTVKSGTIDEAEELKELVTKKTGFIVAVGGGKVIDAAKQASRNHDPNLIFMPTTPSHDGIASPCIYLKEKKNGPELYFGMSRAPYSIIADIKVIARAKNRLFSSGIADLLSSMTSIWDWELAYRLRNENFSHYASMVARTNGQIILKHVNNLKQGNIDSLQMSLKTLIISGFLIGIANNNRVSYGSEHLFAQQDWRLVRDALKTVRAPINAKELNVRSSSVIEALIDSYSVKQVSPIYTILGDSGLTEEAAWNLAIKTGVVGSGLV
ncbi:MAG: iron-containing alcohol dehydrogenase [Candidatus Hodarchaeales archaeon]